MKNWRPLPLSTTLAIWALAGWRHNASAATDKQAGIAMRLCILIGRLWVGQFYRALARHHRFFNSA
jgi:hypothetical protein